MNDVITSRLDVWPCVATRKDKVLSCTAVKVAPFFSSIFFLSSSYTSQQSSVFTGKFVYRIM